jgi:hypothetical protein
MSRVRTKSTESASKRDLSMGPRRGTGRVTRAEPITPGPLLEYSQPLGVNRRWCNSYFGGETTAG